MASRTTVCRCRPDEPAAVPAAGQRSTAGPDRPARGSMARVPPEVLIEGPAGESSSVVAQRIARARSVALARSGVPNARLPAGRIVDVCRLDPAARRLIGQLSSTTGMTARGIHRVLRVARTIADLAGEEDRRSRAGLGGDGAPRGRRAPDDWLRDRHERRRPADGVDRAGRGRRARRAPRARGSRRRSAVRPRCCDAAARLDAARFGHRLRAAAGTGLRQATVDGVRDGGARPRGDRASPADHGRMGARRPGIRDIPRACGSIDPPPPVLFGTGDAAALLSPATGRGRRHPPPDTRGSRIRGRASPQRSRLAG